MKWWGIILIIVAFLSGLYLGKSRIKIEEKTIVEYIDLPIVHVSIIPKEKGFSIPDFPHYIWKTENQIEKVDTAAILADWIIEYYYTDRLIDDSTGTVDYEAWVQYNKLKSISLDYKPKQRTETTIKTVRDSFIPFLFIGYQSNNFFNISGGSFINQYGFAIEYGFDFTGERYIGGKVGLRF